MSTIFEIGENIKRNRLDKGLTQQKLADKLGKSLSLIKKYESGATLPPFNVMKQIADILDIDISNIVDIHNPQESKRIPEDLIDDDLDIDLLEPRVAKYISDIKSILKNTFPGISINNALIVQNTFIKIMAKQQAKEDTQMNTHGPLLEYSVSNNSFVTGKELYNTLYNYYLHKYKDERKRILGRKVSLFLGCNEDYEYTEPEIRIIKEYYEDFPKTDIPKRFIKYFDSNEK